MKPITTKGVFHSVAAVALAVAAGSSFAADTTWSLGGCADATNLGSTATCANPDLVLTGYSNQKNTTTTATSTINATQFSTANLYDWGSGAGIGVVASSESASATGPHAIDNVYGIDALMIQFTKGPVNLTGLTIGWNGTDNATSSYYDSDLSVFVWTGTSAPTLTSLTPNSLADASSGWALVGNYVDVGSGSNTESPLGSSLYSSYWLVSAYSSAYGSGTGLGAGNDAFKLLSVAGNTCTGVVSNGTCGSGGGNNNVPEPGSLALMGIAMAGFVATRRRKQQSA